MNNVIKSSSIFVINATRDTIEELFEDAVGVLQKVSFLAWPLIKRFESSSLCTEVTFLWSVSKCFC